MNSTACWTMGDRYLGSVAVKTHTEDRAHPLGYCVSLVFIVLGKSIGVEVEATNLTCLFVLFIATDAFSVVIMTSLWNSIWRKATYNKQ